MRFAWLWLAVFPALAQHAVVRPAVRNTLPTRIDGNSPAFWRDGRLFLFSSTGNPEMLSESSNDQFGGWRSEIVTVHGQHIPLWIESAWQAEDGILFVWYHHEPGRVCPDDRDLTAPRIGAGFSFDGGRTIEDLGFVLETGYGIDCESDNGFFAGGHGDFSVVPDPEGEYLYFFFTNYSGPTGDQGVVTARMRIADRWQPSGNVFKYYQGRWEEPGIGGRTTAIFPAAKSWQREDTDSFWGPSVHWNTHLERYVMLLNRACCRPGWPQEGIYLSMNNDLSRPEAWPSPTKLMEGSQIGYGPGYYPQVLGLGEGETDSLAGERARLYIHGISNWEIVFSKDQ